MLQCVLVGPTKRGLVSRRVKYESALKMRFCTDEMIKKEDDFKRNLHMFRMDGIESVLSVNGLKLTTLHQSHRFLRIVITSRTECLV